METPKPQTMYEAGKSFYKEAISKANEQLEQAETPFETIIAQENIELSSLKLLHTERREREL